MFVRAGLWYMNYMNVWNEVAARVSVIRTTPGKMTIGKLSDVHVHSPELGSHQRCSLN